MKKPLFPLRLKVGRKLRKTKRANTCLPTVVHLMHHRSHVADQGWSGFQKEGDDARLRSLTSETSCLAKTQLCAPFPACAVLHRFHPLNPTVRTLSCNRRNRRTDATSPHGSQHSPIAALSLDIYFYHKTDFHPPRICALTSCGSALFQFPYSVQYVFFT